MADRSRPDLGAQERAILELLTANPFAGQQEIAAALGLARPTVAAHISALIRKGRILGRGYVFPRAQRIFCCGGATIDRKYCAPKALVQGTSNPVTGHRSFGGVARNVAETLARLGVETSLMTIVGDDENGRSILRQLRDLGVDTTQVAVTSERMTAEYAAILAPDSNLFLGIADMAILDLLGTADLDRVWPHLAAASWVFADCNLSGDLIAALAARRATAQYRLAIDTVSTHKAERLPRDLSGIDLLFLNMDEALAYLAHTRRRRPATPEDAARTLCAAGAKAVVLTRGAEGVVLAETDRVRHRPAVAATPVDVTGAGDAMIAVTLYRLLSGDSLDDAAASGLAMAALTTESEATVLPNLSPQLVAQTCRRRARPARRARA